jgi:hypothetical protein
MKRLGMVLIGFIVLALPAMAQQTYSGYSVRPVAYQWGGGSRLSADDQSRFDSYYSRWLQYRRTNNRDEIVSMEKRMQDVYAHYGIPSNTPYDRVASNGGGYGNSGYGNGGYGRDWHHDRDNDGDHDRDDRWRNNGYGGYGNNNGYGRNQARLSADDQRRFDSYYSRWQQYRATNNQSEVQSMEGRMRDIYAHYNIPPNTPFGAVASGRY